jgi:hypothetical protein
MAWPKEMVAALIWPIGHVAFALEGSAQRGDFIARKAVQATGMGRVAVRLDDLFHQYARGLVKIVDVLGDDMGDLAALDQLRHRQMGPIGLCRAE